ncbi:TPA: restriction endonuclease subunit S [Citrobacter freundii]|uniref:Restriction endonuclease subunit S n=1 Tax=Klebsiella pasteurii TaxID=2587529 RepID=A0ABT5CTI5_9ENTR|nr:MULTISPECIES: restriction endonuclease subunit S [Enterobacteriaceae]HED1543229.1 restriction endonuclease subunit S [Kluyvera cryocrescens]EME2147302.1 restriction endonuclease subunit S [Escherichia coli]MDC0694874.1 restriction endonuclease subunit S [Klebsiella pasteurii]MDC0757119.1 restriction endonuclease subunit S [Klebsiella pasteurii]MDQ2169818.1 restriction endonuclease subunit S [Klebsiella pasteurii]
MSEWEFLQIKDLVSDGSLEKPLDGNHGGIHPKGTDFVSSGIPFVMASDINNSQIDLVGCKFISKQQALSLRKGFAKTGDVLLTHKATLGRTAIVPPLKTDFIMLTPQVTYYRVKDKNRINNHYLKYYFDTPDFQQTLANHGDAGSTRAYIGITAQHDLPVILPPINEQKAIASVLSSLDDKIDLLQRQNKTLESLANTMFRQWFVEGAPDDWETKPLSEVATFTNGLACQKFPAIPGKPSLPVLKIKELNNGISSGSDLATASVKENYIVNHGDVIFSWSASLMVKIWSGPICVLNQHLFKVSSDTYPKWFYFEWCKHYLEQFISISQSHATTMGHIKRQDLDEAMVKIPSNNELVAMTAEMEPLLSQRIENMRQIRTLECLRDTLLPKLMSGDIRVQYAEEAIASVA